MTTRIELSRLLSLRRSYVDVDGAAGVVRLWLPSYFLDRSWAIPIAETAVLGLDKTAMDSMFMTSFQLQEGLLLPYLFTSAGSANVALFFRTPQRMPPLRYRSLWRRTSGLPVGFRETRSAEGVAVDGVLLRAADAKSAVAELTAAGCEPVANPAEWLSTNRAVTPDPNTAQRRLTDERRRTRAVACLGLAIGAGGAGFQIDSTPWRWLLASCAISLTATAVTLWNRAEGIAE